MNVPTESEHGVNKPVVLSVCHHGEGDSWATKLLIEGELESAKYFDIRARGIEPKAERETPEGMRGVELTMDDIRQAVLILVHTSNMSLLRRRFGKALIAALEEHEFLYERGGRECQHVEKNTGCPKKHVKKCCNEFVSLLHTALKAEPADDVLDESVFEAAEKSDVLWKADITDPPKKKKKKKRKGNRARGFDDY